MGSKGSKAPANGRSDFAPPHFAPPDSPQRKRTRKEGNGEWERLLGIGRSESGFAKWQKRFAPQGISPHPSRPPRGKRIRERKEGLEGNRSMPNGRCGIAPCQMADADCCPVKPLDRLTPWDQGCPWTNETQQRLCARMPPGGIRGLPALSIGVRGIGLRSLPSAAAPTT